MACAEVRGSPPIGSAARLAGFSDATSWLSLYKLLRDRAGPSCLGELGAQTTDRAKIQHPPWPAWPRSRAVTQIVEQERRWMIHTQRDPGSGCLLRLNPWGTHANGGESPYWRYSTSASQDGGHRGDQSRLWHQRAPRIPSAGHRMRVSSSPAQQQRAVMHAAGLVWDGLVHGCDRVGKSHTTKLETLPGRGGGGIDLMVATFVMVALPWYNTQSQTVLMPLCGPPFPGAGHSLCVTSNTPEIGVGIAVWPGAAE